MVIREYSSYVCIVSNHHIGPPFYLGASKTYTLEIKGSLFKMFNFQGSWGYQSPDLMPDQRGPTSWFQAQAHSWLLCDPKNAPLGIICAPFVASRFVASPPFLYPESDTKSTPPALFHETKFSPNWNLFFPAASSLIWALSVFRITPIPLNWHCCL